MGTVFDREQLDEIIESARRNGGVEVKIDGPNVADEMVEALGDRAQALTGDPHSLGFSGLNQAGKYTLTVTWCGPRSQ